MKNITIYTKKFLRYIFDRLGYRVVKIGPYSFFDFESFLHRHVTVHGSLHFLQVGANDGVMNDPIYKFNIKNKSLVSGYVLEPLPDMFLKLTENYKFCPNVKAFNLAIHATASEMVLHRVKASRAHAVPEFARGIASFDEMHWKRTSLVPDADFIEQVKVKCVSLETFINLNKIESLDLLLLDTEGYDYEILMSVDFSLIKPRIIRFEHGVRDGLMPHEKFKKLCDYLNVLGYQVIAESYDATAYLLNSTDLVF